MPAVNQCTFIFFSQISWDVKWVLYVKEHLYRITWWVSFSCIFSSLSMCNFLTFEQIGFPFIHQHRHPPQIFLFSNLLYSLSPRVALTDSKCFEKHGTHLTSDWTLNYNKTVLFCLVFFFFILKLYWITWHIHSFWNQPSSFP